MTFADETGRRIMTETQLAILEAINSATMASAPVLTEAVLDPETGELVTKVRGPVSYQWVPDE
jgi:hypothetical protein